MKTENIVREILKQCGKDKEFRINLDENAEVPSSFNYKELEDHMSFKEWDSEDVIDTPKCKIVLDFNNVSSDVFDKVFNDNYINQLIDTDEIHGEIKRWKKNVRHEDDYDSEYHNPKIKILEKNKNSKLIIALMYYDHNL